MTASAPWLATLSQPQYLLTLYFLVVAGLALLAGFARSVTTRSEVGSRFRPAVVARLTVTGVAFVSYLLLITTFLSSYTLTGDTYVPNGNAVMMFALRYTDWSVTVPLLTFELLAVCSVVGPALRRTQLIVGASSFAMIFSGFLGAIVIDEGQSQAQLLIWGGISGVFWIITNVLLIRCVRRSLPSLTTQAASWMRSATILMLSGWVVYPLVYLIQVFGDGGGWATTMQVSLCVADVLVKIGFGTLIHRVAKLRTAEDVRAGDDVHPESIWISSVKQSDAGQPNEVYLAEGASVHPRHARPPMSSAVPFERSEIDDDDL
ncbi:hypothetical protein B7R54_12135 [Subtercola boreus]|uniref:Rhodopsin n=1 Tax=Subtercola boreus TaxID=120213 RepID=A0A3E0VLV3_9MICO|nr:bacteriorhodopsin [Subtercola boreus]RFA09867.1 hypothetical protein B7R54_12135 [Subtercola boreus]TQL53004.1 bacteriorhodopsin [Subtercola boreus]